MEFSKPIIVVSSCLGFEKVRYNGQVLSSKIVEDLKPFVEFINVCPEVAIGLGVPRDPIRIVEIDKINNLIQHNTKRNITNEMNDFSNEFTKNLNVVDGFIFKTKSPTCDLKNVNVYSGMRGTPVINKSPGFFSEKLINKFKDYPIEDDERLKDKVIREHFLTKLFLFANYRNLNNDNKINEFHDSNKLLMKYYNKELFEKLNINDSNYFEQIKLIFQNPPLIKNIKLFFEEISNNINNDEKFKVEIEKYINNKISLDTLKEILKFELEDEKLLEQSFFQPYPKELNVDIDKRRGRSFWK